MITKIEKINLYPEIIIKLMKVNLRQNNTSINDNSNNDKNNDHIISKINIGYYNQKYVSHTYYKKEIKYK